MIYEIFRLHDGPGALRGRKEEESGVQWMVKKSCVVHVAFKLFYILFYFQCLFVREVDMHVEPLFQVGAGLKGEAQRSNLSGKLSGKEGGGGSRGGGGGRGVHLRRHGQYHTVKQKEVLKWISLVFFVGLLALLTLV